MLTRREFLGCALAGLSFRTIPRNIFMPGKKNSSLKITYLTDLHSSEAAYSEAAFDKIYKAVNSEKSDLIVGGGDWITDGNFISPQLAAKRFKRFDSFWNALPGQKVLVPGNHDFVRPEEGGPPDLTLFKSFFGVPNVSRDLGAAKLISLQSLEFTANDKTPYIGEVSQKQLDWLTTELQKIEPQTPIILLLHVPLITLFYQRTEGGQAQAPENRVVRNNIKVLESFEKHNLLLVLQGHLHVSEFMKWNDTSFITGGALCGKWWQGDNYGTGPGFGTVTMGSAGVEWRYRNY